MSGPLPSQSPTALNGALLTVFDAQGDWVPTAEQSAGLSNGVLLTRRQRVECG